MINRIRPTVVQFGAGCIGRGFLGPLWTAAGYEVVYVEIKPDLVAALEARRSYPLRLTGGRWSMEPGECLVTPVRALHRSDEEAIIGELARCAFAATAIGVANLPEIAPVVASGVLRRAETAEEVDDPTLRVLCCENGVSAAADLHRVVEGALANAAAQEPGPQPFAAVATSVGRMVPEPTPELLAEGRLLIRTEPFGELYVDAVQWGDGPSLDAVPDLFVTQDCAKKALRKLYIHNGGHAALAYLGHLRGYAYIWEAVSDPQVEEELLDFWQEAGTALVRALGFSADEQRHYEACLLPRLANRALGDTIERVGRDPARKLRADERLVGPALLCLEEGIEPVRIARVIAAALRFEGAADDPSAAQVRDMAREKGVAGALWEFSRIPASSPLVSLVRDAYNEME